MSENNCDEFEKWAHGVNICGTRGGHRVYAHMGWGELEQARSILAKYQEKKDETV